MREHLEAEARADGLMEKIQANDAEIARLQADRRLLCLGGEPATAAAPGIHTFAAVAGLVTTIVPEYQAAFDDPHLPAELLAQKEAAGTDIASLVALLQKLSARAVEFQADAIMRGTAAAEAAAMAAAAAKQAAATTAAAAEAATTAEAEAAELLRTQQHKLPPPLAPVVPVTAAAVDSTTTVGSTAVAGGSSGSGAVPNGGRRTRSTSPRRECDRTAKKVADQTEAELLASRAAKLSAKQVAKKQERDGGGDGDNDTKIARA